jgi:hypothetical protein
MGIKTVVSRFAFKGSDIMQALQKPIEDNHRNE